MGIDCSTRTEIEAIICDFPILASFLRPLHWTFSNAPQTTFRGCMKVSARFCEELQRFRVFWRLKRAGYVVRSGLKIGVDFSIYKENQSKSHSEYALLVKHSAPAGTIADDPSVADCTPVSSLYGGENSDAMNPDCLQTRQIVDNTNCSYLSAKMIQSNFADHFLPSSRVITWADAASRSRLCSSINKTLVIMSPRGNASLVKRWKV